MNETDGVTDNTDQEDGVVSDEAKSSTSIKVSSANTMPEKPKDVTQVLPAIEAGIAAELNRMESTNDLDKAKFLEQSKWFSTMEA